MAIFVAIFLSVLLQDPYQLDLSKLGSTEARVEMFDVVDYEMKPNAIKRITKAKKIMRYKAKDVAYEPQMILKKDDLIYALESNKAVLVEDIAMFEDNVTINRTDGAYFKGSRLSFDTKDSLLTSDAPFELVEKDLHVKGVGFTYSFKTEFLSANNIHAHFKLEEI